MVCLPAVAQGSGFFQQTNPKPPPIPFVKASGLLDGAFQELDAATLEMWSNTSAYLNGEAVSVELVAGPWTFV